LLLYIAFTLGYFIENRKAATRLHVALGAALLAMAVVLLKVLLPTGYTPVNDFPSSEWAVGVSMSYKLLELETGFAVVSCLLALAAIASLPMSRRIKVAATVLVALFSLGLVLLHQPVLFVWVAVCVAKTVVLKKWSLLLLLVATACLPAATAIGAPVYAIFVLVVCSAVTVLGWSPHALQWRGWNKIAFGLVVAGLVVSGLVRADVHVPVISEAANPILAEREKTHQLEDIISWWEASGYRGYRLVLSQPAASPVESTNVVFNRVNRAPTGQGYLDEYTSSLGPQGGEAALGELLVCLGDETIAGAEVVYAIPGEYNGQATVYRESK